jgi:hypothetical protein
MTAAMVACTHLVRRHEIPHADTRHGDISDKGTFMTVMCGDRQYLRRRQRAHQ